MVGNFEGELYTDKVATFGRHRIDYFKYHSGQEDRVVVTGDPEKDILFKEGFGYDKAKLCAQLGLNPEKKIVFFGSTWTSHFGMCSFRNLQENTIKAFMKAFAGLQADDPDVQLAVKLHPTEYGQSGYYYGLATEAGVRNCHVFEGRLNELLYICDLYAGFRSSIIVNALIFEKPVLLLHFYEIRDDKFFDGLAIQWVFRPEDIYPEMKKYLYDDAAIEEMKKRIPESIEYFNYKPDGRATERVMELICRMAEETLSQPVKERIIDTGITHGNDQDNFILDAIDFSGKRILFMNSMKNLNMDAVLKRKGDSILYFVEDRSPSPQGKGTSEDNPVYSESNLFSNQQNVLYLDFNKDAIDSLRLEKDSFDCIVFKNSLETLYDPWTMLKDVYPFLKDNGKLIIQITNIRNLAVFTSIAQGYFTYSDAGLLRYDRLRFFTSAELAEQAANAGYHITGSHLVMDEYLTSDIPPEQMRSGTFNFQGENFIANNIPGKSLLEMYARDIVMTFQKEITRKIFVSPLNLPKPPDYFENPRLDMIDMIDSRPEMILEIGCGTGPTCRAIKQRYPDCMTIGIDIDGKALEKAASAADRAILLDINTSDLSEAGIREESLDYILYGDVLEHLGNPWEVVRKHKKYLKKDGCVIASIPNIRHQSVLLPLLYGRWPYDSSGILDATHLRFFTLRESRRMLRSAGLYIYEIKGNPDIRPENLNLPVGQFFDFPLQDLTLQNVPRKEMPEFFIIQFLIKAGKDGKRLSKKRL
jgi:2-polyprenyl-3-methyl-5-hydroxy-6-metoxy-1,4-benzoquinol methylase